MKNQADEGLLRFQECPDVADEFVREVLEYEQKDGRLLPQDHWPMTIGK